MGLHRLLPAGLALLLVACGQRGPLYLPEEQPAATSEAAAETESTGPAEETDAEPADAAEPGPEAEATGDDDENDDENDYGKG